MYVPVKIIRIDDDVTQFGKNLPVSTQAHDLLNNQLYVLNTGALATDTIASLIVAGNITPIPLTATSGLEKFADGTTPADEGWRLIGNPTTSTGDGAINLMETGDAPQPNMTYVGGLKLRTYTTAEIGALPAPEAGTVVYNSDTNLVQNFDGTAWVNTSPTGLETITEGGNTGWALIGEGRTNKNDIGVGAIDMTTADVAGRGADGNFSFANNNSQATAQNAIALGQGNKATQTYAVALGQTTIASGSASTSLGRNTLASGDYSLATGQFTEATGPYSHSGGFGQGAAIRVLASGEAAFNFQRSSVSDVDAAAQASVILGGISNEITAAATRSVVLGASNITAAEPDKVYVQKLRCVPLAAAPADVEAGTMYFDSTLNKMRCYDGTTWQDMF